MKASLGRSRSLVATVCFLALLPMGAVAAKAVPEAALIAFKNKVRILRAGAVTWETPAPLTGTNRLELFASDQIQTGERSRGKLLLPDGSITDPDPVTDSTRFYRLEPVQP